MTELKTELLLTLCERYPLGLPNPGAAGGDAYIPIPDSIDDILLAVPIDKHDASRGWKELNLDGGQDGIKACPKSLGIKDGAPLAFRFRATDKDGDGGFVVEWPSCDETYGEVEPRRDEF